MNVILYLHDSNKIRHFIRDCVKRGNSYTGSNYRVFGCKPKFYSIIWTEDEVNPILDAESQIIGWDKKVSEIIPSSNSPVEKGNTTPKEYSEAFKIRQLLDKMSYQDVEDYVNLNITDLNSAKSYIIKLSKVVLALARIMDKEL